jgi:hypothetical protein
MQSSTTTVPLIAIPSIALTRRLCPNDVPFPALISVLVGWWPPSMPVLATVVRMVVVDPKLEEQVGGIESR